MRLLTAMKSPGRVGRGARGAGLRDRRIWPWACGTPVPTARTHWTGFGGFTNSIRRSEERARRPRHRRPPFSRSRGPPSSSRHHRIPSHRRQSTRRRGRRWLCRPQSRGCLDCGRPKRHPRSRPRPRRRNTLPATPGPPVGCGALACSSRSSLPWPQASGERRHWPVRAHILLDRRPRRGQSGQRLTTSSPPRHRPRRPSATPPPR